MSKTLHQFSVLDRASGTDATVELRGELTTRDFIDVERSWGPARLDILTRLDAANVHRAAWPESWHWNWHQKASRLSLPVTITFAAWSLRGPEAVMMVKTAPYQARLVPDVGKHLVYIDFIEVAPWNWTVPSIAQKPTLTGLGSQLVQVAVALSVSEEFRGRVGLHSLPQSEAWYKNRGFTNLGPDLHKQGLAYLERPAAQPQQPTSQSGADT